tara:strand:- start:3248 stop:3955 length:708 start_codon:yes stop_codon:yes gene_type:complete
MIRKLSISLFFTLIFTSLSFSQKTAELGILAGRSYYLGELNPKTHWGNGVGSLTFGGVFRYNLNDRYTLKGSIIRTTLTAKDELESFLFNNQRLASFENTITEFAGEIEFNFLPYKMGDKRHFFSPYLFVGLSYFTNDVSTKVEGFLPAPTNQDGGSKLAMPFGPGVKLSLGKKWAFSMEWGFRKTGYDLIDGLENRVNDVFESGKTYDNDWFVVSGFMLTYKITDEGPCPVYNF